MADGVVDKLKQLYKREWQNERAREANKVLDHHTRFILSDI